jgi:hypothetical protein
LISLYFRKFHEFIPSPRHHIVSYFISIMESPLVKYRNVVDDSVSGLVLYNAIPFRLINSILFFFPYITPKRRESHISSSPLHPTVPATTFLILLKLLTIFHLSRKAHPTGTQLFCSLQIAENHSLRRKEVTISPPPPYGFSIFLSHCLFSFMLAAGSSRLNNST